MEMEGKAVGEIVPAGRGLEDGVKRRRRDASSAAANKNQADHQTTATTVKRSSKFRGVSRHRWTGRYEAHLWDKGSWNPTQRKKGKQVYLGAYDEEESAARAYDLAALKYWGTSTFTNFPVSDYEKEIEIMKSMTKEEYLASLRRRSSGFSRGVSKYRGVARHHHNGRWEARIGRVFGNKYLYLGTYSTQEEAAHAYDIAAIEYRGINAVTNFDLSTYIRWLKPGANPPPLPLLPSFQHPNSGITTFSNHFPTDYHHHHHHHHHHQTPDLSIINSNPYILQQPSSNEETFQIAKTATTTKSSSSPTALGILLRSSVFKELVERNLDDNNKVAHHENNMTPNVNLTPPPLANDGEVGEVFYDGVDLDPVEYLSPSDKMHCLN